MDAKSILTCATLLAGVVLLNDRLDASVESSVVGYTTIAMEAGKWYQIGTPFVALEEGATPTINDVFNTGFSDDDLLQVFNPDTSSYDINLRWGTTRDEDTGWLLNGSFAKTCVAPGQAVFIYKKSGAGNVVLRGKVSSSEVATFGSDAGKTWGQVVCVYPQTLALNNMVWEKMENDDLLQVFNPDTSSYDINLRWGTTRDEDTGWLLNGSFAKTCVAPGQAVFIYKKSGGKGSCTPIAGK